MNFLKKLFGSKKEEEVTVDTTQVKKEKKVKKPAPELVIDKKKYKENKAKKIQAAEKKRLEQLKEVEAQKQAEYLEMQKRAQESAEKLQKERVERKKSQSNTNKVVRKEKVEEKPMDLFGYSYLGFDKGQRVTVEIMQDTKEGFFVRGVENFQDALLPHIEVENEEVKVGDKIEVLVFKYYAEEYYVSRRRLLNKIKLETEMSKVSEADRITGSVVEYKEPNFIVELDNGLRGKVYIRKMDRVFINDVSPYLHKKFEFVIEKKIANSHNLQFELNRRSLLDEQTAAAIENIGIGQVIEVDEYEFNKGGISFSYNAIRCFVPMGEIAHKFFKSVEDAQNYVTGPIKVQITDIEKRRNEFNIIGSMRVLTPSPWESFIANYSEGQVVTGVVKRIKPFGLFVNVAQDIDGLLHQSQFDSQTSTDIKKIKAEDTITVKIKEIDLEKNLVSLTQLEDEIDTETIEN